VDNQDIAQALNYSVYTVANRLRTIYEKLHVTNRTRPRSMPCARAGPRWTSRRGKRSAPGGGRLTPGDPLAAPPNYKLL